MKVDIRGRRLLGPDLLLPDEQCGILYSNDIDDLDDGDDTMDAWIPNRKQVRERQAQPRQASAEINEDEAIFELGNNFGTSMAISDIQEDIADLIATETDDGRKQIMETASCRQGRLIAGDIANLKSPKLLGFLAARSEVRNEDVGEDQAQTSISGNATLKKGAGTAKGVCCDFSFSVADL